MPARNWLVRSNSTPQIESAILGLRESLAMPNHSVHKASDLGHEERLLVERWLGRPLSNDETISVNAYRPHSAPAGDERDMLRRKIVAQAQEMGSRAGNSNEKEVDALVDEAIVATRNRRE